VTRGATVAHGTEGWFRASRNDPVLFGQRCGACGATVFPPTAMRCPNPSCRSADLRQVELARRGRIWSYTDARFPPPAPYPAADPFEPFALIAVELDDGLVVVGQGAAGTDVTGLAVGMDAELVVEPLVRGSGEEELVWKWRVLPRKRLEGPTTPTTLSDRPPDAAGAPGAGASAWAASGAGTAAAADAGMAAGASAGTVAGASADPHPDPGTHDAQGSAGERTSPGRHPSEARWRVATERGAASDGAEQVVVLGVGMHPWGKWGDDPWRYALVACERALDDAGITLDDVDFVAGAASIRCGYPGFVAGATLAALLGPRGLPVTSAYGACASGALALDAARARILAGLADVVLVAGAEQAPKGFFAPVAGERPFDPDWIRFRVLGLTNPAYFGLYATRRMARYGTTEHDLASVKVKNARHATTNPLARYRQNVSLEEVLASPYVSWPLRLLEICATSDGAAALVVASAEWARWHLRRLATRDDPRANRPLVRLAAVSVASPRFGEPQLDMPRIATDGVPRRPAQPTLYHEVARRALEAAGLEPRDLDLAEVYDLSTALELDWYEAIGLCEEGEAEHLLASGATALGGRIPVNSSGGLSSFGEAIPAQALAQLCELVWQLRGEVGARQIPDARVGIAVNLGLFGHASGIVVVR
jgi:acetyl-CoA acetyltransferase/uncharacterized OB-fold protein